MHHLVFRIFMTDASRWLRGLLAQLFMQNLSAG